MQSITTTPLAEFLSQDFIEESPAWEFIDGRSQQKPMPTLFHSRLQRNCVNFINERAEAYEAIQELRCVVPPLSPVPDIAVIGVERIPDEDGPFQAAPDWVIEIRSPGQNTSDLQRKILNFLDNGTRLAWLIDIQREQIWVWQGNDLPLIYQGSDVLPTLGLPEPVIAEKIIAMAKQR